MIYFTGDIHGDVRRIIDSIHRFDLDSDDVIVILGDAGLNYFGNKRGDSRTKRLLNAEGVTILCIHGNHEMRPGLLESYHCASWHGGTVFIEDEYLNILFAKDGEIFDLDDKKAIVIGGAYSVDKYYRLARGAAWFPDEQPTTEIKRTVEAALEAVNWNIDIVLSHTCPARFIPTEAFLTGLDQSTVDRSTEDWLNTIEQKLSYSHWFCGHWHIDKRIDKMHFLFNSMECLPSGENGDGSSRQKSSLL